MLNGLESFNVYALFARLSEPIKKDYLAIDELTILGESMGRRLNWNRIFNDGSDASIQRVYIDNFAVTLTGCQPSGIPLYETFD